MRQRDQVVMRAGGGEERAPEPAARARDDDPHTTPCGGLWRRHDVVLVGAVQPLPVVAVPGHGVGQAIVEPDLGRPAEPPQPVRGDPVPEVVARPVGDERDQVVGDADERHDPLRELLVLDLGTAADVVEHAGLTPVEHRQRRSRPVADVQELASLHAVRVHGHRQPLERADRERRDHALDLPRTVGVRAAHDRHVDAVRRAVRGTEQVGGGLARRVRGARRERRVLGEATALVARRPRRPRRSTPSASAHPPRGPPRARPAVPSTFDSRNPRAASIERSTCDSAAAWITASTPPTTSRTSASSLMSPCTKVNRGSRVVLLEVRARPADRQPIEHGHAQRRRKAAHPPGGNR